MNNFIIGALLTIILPPIIMLLAYNISMNANLNREKQTPFECGFDPKNNARIPFSTRFFLLAVIFLVFDIEIVLIMPAPMLLLNGMKLSFVISLMVFLVILLGGLLHEWREGSLNWAN